MKQTYIKPVSLSVEIHVDRHLMDGSVVVNRSNTGIQTTEDLGGTPDTFNRSKDGSKWGEW